MKKTHLAVTLLTAHLAVHAGAIEPEPPQGDETDRQVVVTASRLEMALDEVGSSVTVITAADLERTQTRTVLDALRQVPGVTATRYGGPGQTGIVHLRGAPAGFTQVLIDGVKVNDPAGIGTLYDFGNLHVDNVERIEVLRGPQSTLYGSDAMAGVIHIITKQGEGAPSTYAEVEGGSYETWRAALGSSGRIDRFNYALSLSQLESGGIPATDLFGERDSYRNRTLSTRFGYDLTDEAAVSLIARFVESVIHYDSFDATYAPSPEGKIEKDELFLRAEAQLLLMEGRWEQVLGAGHTRLRRDFLESPGLPDERFDGDVTQADWQHNLYWSDWNTVTLGVDWEYNQAETRESPAESMSTLGLFVQDHIAVGDHWFTTLGARVDDNDSFGTEATYRASSSYRVADWGSRVKASYGTGFKAPSLFELYASSPFAVGNPNLDPQTSRGWDVGFEQEVVGELLSVGATYFEISFDDLIDWVPGADLMSPGTYRNVNEAKTKGVEAFAASRLNEWVAVRVDYTYLDNEDKADSGAFDLRRPSNQFVARVDLTPVDALSISLLGQYVGRRTDFGDVELDAYTLVHMAASYRLTDTWTVFGRVENLLDEDYVEVNGYNTPGLAGYGGVRAVF